MGKQFRNCSSNFDLKHCLMFCLCNILLDDIWDEGLRMIVFRMVCFVRNNCACSGTTWEYVSHFANRKVFALYIITFSSLVVETVVHVSDVNRKCFTWFGIICKFKKREKHPWWGVTFSKVTGLGKH